MKKLSSIISVLFHPILLPSIFIVIICFSGFYFNSFLKAEAFRVIILTVLIFSFFVPMLIFSLSKMLNVIESFEMHRPSERIFALLIVSVSVYFAYKMLAKFDLPELYYDYLFALLIILILACVISAFYKISLHMIGWGVFTSLIFVYIFKFELSLYFYLPIAFLLSGVVAWARLERDAHSPDQIYSGYGLGLLASIYYFI